MYPQPDHQFRRPYFVDERKMVGPGGRFPNSFAHGSLNTDYSVSTLRKSANECESGVVGVRICRRRGREACEGLDGAVGEAGQGVSQVRGRLRLALQSAG